MVCGSTGRWADSAGRDELLTLDCKIEREGRSNEIAEHFGADRAIVKDLGGRPHSGLDRVVLVAAAAA
jgi:hypothetical protein